MVTPNDIMDKEIEKWFDDALNRGTRTIALPPACGWDDESIDRVLAKYREAGWVVIDNGVAYVFEKAT